MFGLLPTFLGGTTGGVVPGTFGRRAAMQHIGNLTGRRVGSMWAMVGPALASLFDETWPGTLGTALPAAWTVQAGTPQQHGSGQMGFTAGSGLAMRDTATTNMVLTLVINPDDHFPGIVFRSNSTGVNAEHLVFNESIGKIRFYEEVGGVDTNIVDGTTTFTDTTAVQYTVRVTLAGTALTVELKIGAGSFATEITATMAQNLAGTYVGLSSSGISSGGIFGEFKAV